MKSLKLMIVAAGFLIPSSPVVAFEIPNLKNYAVVIDHVIESEKSYFDLEMDLDGDNIVDVIYRYEVQRQISNQRYILGKPHGIWLDTNENGIFETHEYLKLQDTTIHNGKTSK